MAGGERASVTIPVHLEDHREVAPPGPEEVPVERVRQPTLVHRGRGGHEALRRDLPAVQALARAEVGVTATEEVAVDTLQRQQRDQVVGWLELCHRSPLRPVPLGPTRPTSRVAARTTPWCPRSCACVPSAGRRRGPHSMRTRTPWARPSGRPVRHVRPWRRAPGIGPPLPRPVQRPAPGTTVPRSSGTVAEPHGGTSPCRAGKSSRSRVTMAASTSSKWKPHAIASVRTTLARRDFARVRARW